MQNIILENRAVAFIDVLGFKPLVEGASKDEQKLKELNSLIDDLLSAVPKLNSTVSESVPKELIPKHIYISDCIILSAPLKSTLMPSYDGLTTLVMRVIQISHILLAKGFLIRGGISVGEVWHTDLNIIGSGYQEAYLLEQKADVPRVILSAVAENLWLQTQGRTNEMCLRYKNKLMVNLLHEYYIDDKSHGGVERTLKNYCSIADQNLNAVLPSSAEYKWWWFKRFIEDEVKRCGLVL